MELNAIQDAIRIRAVLLRLNAKIGAAITIPAIAPKGIVMKIKITTELMADLKDKAEKATSGPWIYDDGCVYLTYDPPKENRVHDWSSSFPRFVCDFDDDEYHQYESGKEARANAHYVAAANPAVILALLAKIEELENVNRALKPIIADKR